jgi:hypothetical protein
MMHVPYLYCDGCRELVGVSEFFSRISLCDSIRTFRLFNAHLRFWCDHDLFVLLFVISHYIPLVDMLFAVLVLSHMSVYLCSSNERTWL